MKVIREKDAPRAEQEKENFTGKVMVRRILETDGAVGMRVSVVTFEAGARTFWHAHRGDQILYVLRGKGRVQKLGREAEDIETGDFVCVAPYEEHWHGARPVEKKPMVHIAITIGKTDWMEEVSEKEYLLLT